VIAYRDQRSSADPRRLLRDLNVTVSRSSGAGPTHELAVNVLIDAGTLESAVADTVFPQVDGTDPLTNGLRRISLAAGHVLWHTWRRFGEGATVWWDRLWRALTAIEVRQLPPRVETTTPEGYAYYAVYPEMYLQAARSCFGALGRMKAICLGLRSIGCSLSAVVAAALEEMGCSVESFTLRPRGHPFSRSPSLTGELAQRFAGSQDAHFLLVDEGPGLSGSSLAGTAALLHNLGIANDRIHLFPSWSSDGTQLRSAVARERWTVHRQFTGSFEDVWLRSGRLQERFPGDLHDFSAGLWRRRVIPEGQRYPAVQPQHERRKYLLKAPQSLSTTKLLSFAGLGTAAERKVARLEQLASAGFTPASEQVGEGFMLRPFVEGEPVQPGSADLRLLEFAAAYLAHLYQHHAVEPTTSESTLQEMLRINVAEGLEDSRLEKQLSRIPAAVWSERPVALDGRVLAHEWIATERGYLKVDAMDHHDDHFFPGCQDIAWDVASASIELGLTRAGRAYLVHRYRSLSGDRTIASRLHPYACAYLAFRLGYTDLAAGVLGNSGDARRFVRERQRYHELLRRELSTPREMWNG
jgi:hypothetical protein